ncbi:hypothetical protein NLI96_g1159 [Meripilus lineatus]|uniref:D-lactate dehydratase n=1 Tax=Meripilus lineatus TaxID=2056292 RepID=A0AAD5VAZ3_9APHY|nr:hypothetical protein NLI96_g1159 [Physisporinus lineatus]
MPKALILIADGTEEMEFTITYDTLVRAGVTCQSAFVPAPAESSDLSTTFTNPPFARGSRGINILPDTYFSPQEAVPEKFDLLVIPGGAKGAETLSTSSPVQHVVRSFLQEGKYVGMICAGSLAALTSGLPNQPITSHPSVKNMLDKGYHFHILPYPNLLTMRLP